MKKILLLVAAAAVTAVSCNKNRVDIWVDNSPIIEFKDPRFQNALIELSSMYGDYTYSDGKKTYIQFKDMNGDGKVSEMEASRVEYLDLSGYKIRNLDELTYFTSLKVLYCQNNGVDDSRLEVHDTITTAYESLEQGKVDAVIQDSPNAYYYINTTDGTNLEVVGDQFNQGQSPYAIAISNDAAEKNDGLVDLFNQALKELQDNGTMDKLTSEWLE